MQSLDMLPYRALLYQDLESLPLQILGYLRIILQLQTSVIGGLFGGIRVSEEEETQGLDIGEHGMEAYPDFASAK